MCEGGYTQSSKRAYHALCPRAPKTSVMGGTLGILGKDKLQPQSSTAN